MPRELSVQIVKISTHKCTHPIQIACRSNDFHVFVKRFSV